jgi:DNA polymerase
MHTLNIDLETYSSVNIGKAGLYKYVESSDFEIMLLAYSLDGKPARILDLLGDNWKLPQHQIAQWLTDPQYIKSAYNAPFEIACLSKELGVELDPAQWRDTMLHGLYCGYPAGLDACGKALGLPEDKQKMSAGKALIRYFCAPCAFTKSNGGRTRNLPHHDRARWALFKQYCAQDVEAEMEIERRLSNYPVPGEIQAQWETDLRINRRGVTVDTTLVVAALAIDKDTKGALADEAAAITGLTNPNSVKQLTAWLEDALDLPIDDLRKTTVDQLLKDCPENEQARRMLEIRQEYAKTSIKKYAALESAVCADERVRGLLQFYGANRTGRWAGRLVQVQNLPRTYLEPLPLARDLIKAHKTDHLRLFWGSVPDTLSQSIRTSFVAAQGCLLIDADFSAIEARVISWLAGEEWRMEVFRTHGRIYEASASQMFGVPLEKIKKGNPEYALRQKGKVAELALGYQGGTHALETMGALHMGLIPEELPDIVQRWRDANARIRDLWYSVDAAAVQAIKTGVPQGVRGLIFAREADPANGQDFMTVLLPAGRKLFYAKPALGANRWGGESITYRGVNQTTKKWGLIETYGGKLVENAVQAIARDCLALAIERLEAAGFSVIFHVHDEVVIDRPAATPADLDRVCAIMAQPIPWARGLPMAADGWVNQFYKKD